MYSTNQFHWVFLLWTFPGVVIHELAHAEFCRYYRIPVEEACYFQLDDPAGYVIHARPKSYYIAFMISIAPVILNTAIAYLCGVSAGYFLFPFEGVHTLPEYPPVELVIGVFSIWIGISSAVHALPSKQDAKVIWAQTRANWYNPFVLMVIPIVVIIELLHVLRSFKIHIIAGIIVFVFGVYSGANTGEVITVARSMVEHYLLS